MKVCRKRMQDWNTTPKGQVQPDPARDVSLAVRRKDTPSPKGPERDVLAGSGRLNCTVKPSGKPILVTALRHDADAPRRSILHNEGGKC